MSKALIPTCVLLLTLTVAGEPAYKGKPLEHWAWLLKDENPSVRIRAAGVLWHLGCLHGMKTEAALLALAAVYKMYRRLA